MRLTDAEWKIMTAVWDLGGGTARDVHDAVRKQTDWEYSTVRTMLTRLVEKKVLKISPARYASVYEPLVGREGALRAEVDSLADRAFGGALAPLVHFLVGDKKLSAKDREQLRRILDDDEG